MFCLSGYRAISLPSNIYTDHPCANQSQFEKHVRFSLVPIENAFFLLLFPSILLLLSNLQVKGQFLSEAVRQNEEPLPLCLSSLMFS